ncbi:hypothetical protein Tco_1104187 [Tanacetum coccineum]
MVAAMKHMASNFAKLEKFEGVDFRRWQKKMHFLLSSMSVVYVLTAPMLEDGGLILNGMSDSLFDVYQNVETSKELWDTLEAKYMAEDASSKNFLVSNLTNYKMTDSRLVLEQYNKLLGILRRFTRHKMNMDESVQHLILSASQLHSNIQLSWLLTRCIDNLIVFSKLLAVNGFEISLPVAVCSGVANALVQHYGALITIQFLVNYQPLTDLRSLYQSRLLWTSQFLMSVRHGELMTICCVVAKPTLKQSFSTPLQLPDTQTIP